MIYKLTSTSTFRYLLLIIFLCITLTANAGKHPYQPIGREISYNVIEILKKYGIPVKHDRGSKWYRSSQGSDSWVGGTPSLGVHLYNGLKIPHAAQMEIIQYCMKLHESRGRREIIRITIRKEFFEPLLIKPKPYFELTLDIMK